MFFSDTYWALATFFSILGRYIISKEMYLGKTNTYNPRAKLINPIPERFPFGLPYTYK